MALFIFCIFFLFFSLFPSFSIFFSFLFSVFFLIFFSSRICFFSLSKVTRIIGVPLVAKQGSLYIYFFGLCSSFSFPSVHRGEFHKTHPMPNTHPPHIIFRPG